MADFIGLVYSDNYLAYNGIVSKIMEGSENETINEVYIDLHIITLFLTSRFKL